MTTINGGTGPIATPRATPAGAPAPANQTTAAGPPQGGGAVDALDTAIALVLDPGETINLDNISGTERAALGGILQNYMQDKTFTAAERAKFKETLKFYAESPAAPEGGGGPVKTPGEQALDAAKDKLAGAVASNLQELQGLRQLAEGLDWAQGGDVDTLNPGRKERFMNNLKAAEKYLLQTPPDVERYRTHLSWARTIMNPPARPLNEAGESRHQKYWGKPVPGAEAALAKLNGLVSQAGHKNDKLDGSLFDLRGDVIEAQTRVDAEKEMAATKAKLTGKEGELADWQKKAAEYGAAYRQIKQKTVEAIDKFGNEVLIKLAAKAGDPAAQEAMKLFSSASNAAKIGQYGSANTFLDRLGDKLKQLGINGDGIAGLKGRISETAAAWRKSHNANMNVQRLDQEVDRMRKGIAAAEPAPAADAPKPEEPTGGGAPKPPAEEKPTEANRPERPNWLGGLLGGIFAIGIFPVFPIIWAPVMWAGFAGFGGHQR